MRWLFLLFWSWPVLAFLPQSGQFQPQRQCEAFHSIREQSNPGKWFVEPGQSYPIVGMNRAGGNYWQILINDERRWVAVDCGATEKPQAERKGFDHYTLAMSWHSGFCSENKHYADCRQPRADLVLHGLWPSLERPPHPAFCDGSEKRRFCDHKALGIEASQLNRLSELMPGVASCLQRHQWHKHGSCSGLPRNRYFEHMLNYGEWLRAAKPVALMRKHRGRTISRQLLLDWFERWGGVQAVTLHCRSGKLTEVRLRLKRPLNANPSLSSLSQSSGRHSCPRYVELAK